ncbi:MAG: hypothetical protein ACE5I1_13365 [bacterium]
MQAITYSKLQELVKRLPASKLSLAYSFLTDLADEKEVKSPQTDILNRPLKERRRILAKQAKQMVKHYKQAETERQDWQAGDSVDEY